MKKLIIALVVLGAVGAGAWYFLNRGPDGKPPALAATLPAQHTAAAFGVTDLVGVVKAVDEASADLPKDDLGQAGVALDPKKRSEALGFDPGSAEGWTGIGVDASAGLVVTLDARVSARGEPLPIVMAKITDEAKLAAYLTKQSGETVTISGDAVTVDGDALLYGKRGAYQALLIAKPSRVEAARAGFKLFLADGSSIAADPAFKSAFQEAEAPPLFFGFAGLTGAGPMADALKAPKDVIDAIPFYEKLFPAMGMSADAKTSRFRLVASEKGVEILRKLFVPAKSAPKFSRYIPSAGWAATRVSVNLKQVLDGVAALLPPSVPEQVRGQLGMATMALPMIAGFSWEELTAAFSGHVAVGIDVKSASQVQMGLITAAEAGGIVLVGIADGAAADSLIGKLIELLPKGKTAKPITVAGAKGYVINLDDDALPVAVRDGDVLVIGPSEAAVKAAIELSKDKSMASTPAAEQIDGDWFYAGAYDVANLAKEAPKEMAGLVAGIGFVNGGMRVDRDGILGAMPGTGSTALARVMLAGMASWLTVVDKSTAPSAVEAFEAAPPPGLIPPPPPVPAPAAP